MPELPEVESLARFLRQQADGHVIDRADSAAISVLKTYRPDLTALRGRTVTDTQRHGKFLDLVAGARAPAATAARPMTAPCTWSSTWPGPGGSAGGRTSPRRRRAPARARSASGCGSPTAPAST